MATLQIKPITVADFSTQGGKEISSGESYYFEATKQDFKNMNLCFICKYSVGITWAAGGANISTQIINKDPNSGYIRILVRCNVVQTSPAKISAVKLNVYYYAASTYDQQYFYEENGIRKPAFYTGKYRILAPMRTQLASGTYTHSDVPVEYYTYSLAEFQSK